MKCPPRLAGPVICCIAIATNGLPQSADAGHEPDIRVTVDLVQVDAVVTDAAGRHVPDLKADDFRIFEDGKPQKITHFSYVQGMRTPPVLTAPKQAGQMADLMAGPPPLEKSQVQRTIVLLADNLGLSSDDIPATRFAMKKFVDREMRRAIWRRS